MKAIEIYFSDLNDKTKEKLAKEMNNIDSGISPDHRFDFINDICPIATFEFKDKEEK